MSENGDRPEWLSFKDAVAWAGVSRQRLNQAIWRGEIAAERGGPGVKARVNYQSLTRWLYERGLLTRTPEPSTSTAIERLERLVTGIDQHLEALDRVQEAMSDRMDALSRQFDALNDLLSMTLGNLEDAHRAQLKRLQENMAQREREYQHMLQLRGALSGPEEPSSRQVGTVASTLNYLVQEGRPHSDQDVAAYLAESKWDAGVVQRCLDQLRADGRYQQILERAQPS
jgi:CRP-like cAMP-binding protein